MKILITEIDTEKCIEEENLGITISGIKLKDEITCILSQEIESCVTKNIYDGNLKGNVKIYATDEE